MGRPLAVCKLPSRAVLGYRASAVDTDHATGDGPIALTANYFARRDSFTIGAVYALDPTSRLHASYAVTDEKITSIGVETGFSIFGKPSVIDLMYLPPNDTARAKMTFRTGKTVLMAYFSFANVKANAYANHKEQYELSTMLSPRESLNLFFDTNSKAANIKMTRKLDKRNKVDACYVYENQEKKYMKVKLKHSVNKWNSLGVSMDYGKRKYGVDWDIKSENGPWSFKAGFPFDKSPRTGDFSIKRRFEF